MAPFLSIVIPAYNEERRLPTTLEQIAAFAAEQPFEIELLIVDDGSSDATAAQAEAFAATHPHVVVLHNDHRGKGYAVRSGVLAAQGRYVLFTDADLAVPMSEWQKFQPLLEAGYDVVIGSREGLGARRIGEPRHRHLMGRAFNMLVRAIALRGIQDTQCGFKAFRREAGRCIFKRVQLYGDAARPVQGAAVTAFDVEVLFLARKLGYRIAEVPVLWRYGSETKVDPLRDSWRNFSDVVRVRWNDLRGLYAGVPVAGNTPGK
ncbi:dolichyl-phosphate beta-glucosyltransferase [Kallotenue papyrolyticum]|uniref:dolichyl-phosphate beta-glucosyltransferase n=1 Tax=Kallotenue papyrolyticum TaxID=1325125 RepID=UPI00047859DC|nr:dolichyl-phosphate beta-glucosyltransferase [Kallotenue papyrolyticum]